MVVAKDDAALAHLGEQFSSRSIDRLYWAVVWGQFEDAGRVETNLARDPRNRKRMAVVEAPAGKRAVTNYQLIEALSGTSLVQFKLETGRTHQIRVHAQHLGHPIFGDGTYRGRKIRVAGLSVARKRFFSDLLDAMPRQALHAKTLGFTHPVTGERLQFDSDLPDDMHRLVTALRLGS
jgi:23S rRNA pseudouridine1911/1915/1917 synthase